MHERDLYALYRRQREYVTKAATRLRHDANQDHMARRGTHPEYAYGLASILDTIVLGWTGLDEQLRERTLAAAEGILREPSGGAVGPLPAALGDGGVAEHERP